MNIVKKETECWKVTTTYYKDNEQIPIKIAESNENISMVQIYIYGRDWFDNDILIDIFNGLTTIMKTGRITKLDLVAYISDAPQKEYLNCFTAKLKTLLKLINTVEIFEFNERCDAFPIQLDLKHYYLLYNVYKNELFYRYPDIHLKSKLVIDGYPIKNFLRLIENKGFKKRKAFESNLRSLTIMNVFLGMNYLRWFIDEIVLVPNLKSLSLLNNKIIF